MERIPYEITWQIIMFLELNEIHITRRINKEFYEITQKDEFWEEYAKNLKIEKVFKEDDWKTTIEKFFFTNSNITYDSFSDAFSLCIKVLGTKGSGKMDLIQNYFNVDYTKNDIQSQSLGAYLTTEIDGKKFTIHLRVCDEDNRNDKFEMKTITSGIQSDFYFLCFNRKNNSSFQKITTFKNYLQTIPSVRMKFILIGIEGQKKKKEKFEYIVPEQTEYVSEAIIEEFLKQLNIQYFTCNVQNRQEVKTVFEKLIKDAMFCWKFYNLKQHSKDKEYSKSKGFKHSVCTVS